MIPVRLIPEWRYCWRFTSIQAAALLVGVNVLRDELLPLFEFALGPEPMRWINAVLGALVILLRVIDQPALQREMAAPPAFETDPDLRARLLALAATPGPVMVDLADTDPPRGRWQDGYADAVHEAADVVRRNAPRAYAGRLGRLILQLLPVQPNRTHAAAEAATAPSASGGATAAPVAGGVIPRTQDDGLDAREPFDPYRGRC